MRKLFGKILITALLIGVSVPINVNAESTPVQGTDQSAVRCAGR